MKSEKKKNKDFKFSFLFLFNLEVVFITFLGNAQEHS